MKTLLRLHKFQGYKIQNKVKINAKIGDKIKQKLK